MTTHTISKNQNTLLEITGSGNTWIINKNVVIDSPGTGIHEAADLHDNTIVINGEVHGPGNSNSAIQAEGKNVSIEISETGILTGNFGVSAYGDDADVVNYGHITSLNVAVSMGSENGHFINHGMIDAGHYGFEGHQVTRQTFENDGTIISESGLTFLAENLFASFDKGSLVQSSDTVIKTQSQTGSVAHIVNEGILTAVGNSFLTAIVGGQGRELVRNSGTITGNIELGAGNDRYDGRGGKVLDGVVIGEDGNDTYILTDKHTRAFDGFGGGHDRLTVSFTTTLEASNEMEVIRQSGKADIDLHASGTDNVIRGNSGDNRLYGLGGDDTMVGGKGTDHLAGGDGADMFNFKPHMDREIVMDFVDGMDHLGFVAGKEITSINDLIKHHAADVNGDLVISGDGTEMTIRGMHLADLSSADFIS